MILRETAKRLAMVGRITRDCGVIVDVAKAEPIFRNSRQYIERGAEARPGSRCKAEEHLLNDTATQMMAPQIVIVAHDDGSFDMRFLDFRHRYCVLRDSGAEEILCSTDFRSAEFGLKAGVVRRIIDPREGEAK